MVKWWNSPIYCDNRICLSFKIRDFLANSIAEEIKKMSLIIHNNGVATEQLVLVLVANKLNAHLCKT